MKYDIRLGTTAQKIILKLLGYNVEDATDVNVHAVFTNILIEHINDSIMPSRSDLDD